MDQLRQLIILHEGLKLKPYKDTVGKLTIGVGRNLDDVGISEDEALMMLDHDLTDCEVALTKYDWYVKLDDVRQGVIIELAFNVGLAKVLAFKKMISALANKDYAGAANELLDSSWATQVGTSRADNMASRLLRGRYP
jgi:lysozyme